MAATIDGHHCEHLLVTLPQREIQELIDYLLGVQPLDPCCVADNAVGVLRYVVGTCCADHCPIPVPATSAPSTLSRNECADGLKKLLTRGAGPFAATDWGRVLVLAFQILQEILAGLS